MSAIVHSRIAALAGRQHLVFSRKQAFGAKATRGMIEAALGAGRWEPVFRGVYKVAGSPATPEQLAMAACLAAGDNVLASHATAVKLWCLDELGIRLELPAGPVEVTVPRGKRRMITGVRVYEARHLSTADRSKVSRVPVTTMGRTLVDVAPRLDADTLERLLDEMLRRRFVTIPRLTWHLGRSRGGTKLRRLVAQRDPTRAVRDSDLEDLFAKLVDLAGLPQPVTQHRVRDWGRALGRVDFAYPEVRVAVETDGGQHLAERQKREDIARQNRIQSRDWTLLRFYRSDLQGRPEHVCADVARTLASRAIALTRTVPRTRQ